MKEIKKHLLETLKEVINYTVDTKGGTLKVNVHVRPHYYY